MIAACAAFAAGPTEFKELRLTGTMDGNGQTITNSGTIVFSNGASISYGNYSSPTGQAQIGEDGGGYLYLSGTTLTSDGSGGLLVNGSPIGGDGGTVTWPLVAPNDSVTNGYYIAQSPASYSAGFNTDAWVTEYPFNQAVLGGLYNSLGGFGNGFAFTNAYLGDSSHAFGMIFNGNTAFFWNPINNDNLMTLDDSGEFAYVAGGCLGIGNLIINQSIRVSGSAPAATDAGTAGDMRFDDDYIYRCFGSGDWRRTPVIYTTY